MMMLGAMYDRNRTPASDFDLLAIAVDDDLAAVKQFVSDSKLPFPVVLDHNRSLANAYQIRSVPTELLIDTDGKVTFGSAGFSQRPQNEMAQRLGIRPGDIRMEMGAPNGRGN
jgi:peroxiredoxin